MQQQVQVRLVIDSSLQAGCAMHVQGLKPYRQRCSRLPCSLVSTADSPPGRDCAAPANTWCSKRTVQGSQCVLLTDPQESACMGRVAKRPKAAHGVCLFLLLLFASRRMHPPNSPSWSNRPGGVMQPSPMRAAQMAAAYCQQTSCGHAGQKRRTAAAHAQSATGQHPGSSSWCHIKVSPP